MFLENKPLLAEGRGLCTTAVATDIEYGNESLLEVFNWTDEKHDADTCVKTINNPSADDVNAATVSSDMSTRSELAKQVSRVRITTPNEALKGYTVIDTPGLDDPEQKLLLNTTYRIIPSADVALLVVEPKMLSEIEMGILRKDLIGKNGISRLLLLVSYNAKKMDFDEEQRADIVKTIKAQLENIGRGDIEVEMYCFDPSIEDIMSDISEIRMTLRAFLEENALPGREEKLATLLKSELEAIQMQIAAQLKTAGASEAEVAATEQRLNDEVDRFKAKCERAFEGLKTEFGNIRDQMFNDVDLAVEGVFDRFYGQMEAATDINSMRKLAQGADTILKSDLQTQISVVGIKLKEKINDAVSSYSNEISSIHASWDLYVSNEFGVKRPFVAKIPPFVYDVINTGALYFILPGGWIVAIVAHLLGRNIFNPTTWLAKEVVLGQMKKELDNSKGEVRQQIMDQISENLKKSFEGIKESIEAANRKQVEAIRSGITAAKDSGAAIDRAKLESAQADIEAALANL